MKDAKLIIVLVFLTLVLVWGVSTLMGPQPALVGPPL